MKKFLVLAALALSAIQIASAAPAPQGLPAATSNGNVTFLSGGIGLGESAAIQQAAKSYPLELEFVVRAKPRDEYTSNVHVKVINSQHQNVIDTVAQGPFLLARFPDGKYRIEAMENGVTKVRDVIVKADAPKHLIFEWTQ